MSFGLGVAAGIAVGVLVMAAAIVAWALNFWRS
jgi:hypothetical protein